MIKLVRRAALTGVLVLGVMACAVLAPPIGEPEPLAGTEWRLISLDGHDFSDEPGEYSIRFEPDGSLGGSNGCSGLEGDYDVRGSDLQINLRQSNIMLTMCFTADPPSPAEEVTDLYYDALDGARRYGIADGQLTIIDRRRRELIFEPAE